MRAWGVEFPQRGQPGFQEAITFTEQSLLSTNPKIEIKQEFDIQNMKVVDITHSKNGLNFSRDAITQGFGWHLEKETNRFGPFLLAQLKAKRLNFGIWANNFNYRQIESPTAMPKPSFPGMMNRMNNFVPTLSYWETSFGKNSQTRLFFLSERKRKIDL